MKKLLFISILTVLAVSCSSFASSEEKIDVSVVHRTTRVLVGGVSHTLIYLDNGKMLHVSDVFDAAKSGGIKKISFAQENDTVFYNSKDEILDIRFCR